jgi:glycine/D-amino acid oxidase-like deaminating enzyme
VSPPVRFIQGNEHLPKAVDVVVIGGGIAGTATALALRRKGRSVALVEKGIIAGEQSSRNWGWCRQQNRDVREIPLIKHSLQMWEQLSAATGIELGFRRTGLVYATTKPSDLADWERWAEAARDYQVHTRVLSAREAKEMTPGSTGAWIGGVHSPTDGRAEPALAVPGMAEAAQKLGATIHQNCAVRGLDIQGGRVVGVVTEKGSIRADAVLCAGGAWTGMFCRRHGIRLMQASIRSTSFFTDMAPAVTDGGISLPDVTFRRRLDGGYTVGMSGRGRLHITPQGLRYARQFWPMFQKRRWGLTYGAGRSFFRGPESLESWSFDATSPFERTRTLDPAPDGDLVRFGLASLAAAYPTLAGLKVAKSWGGLVDSTPDAIPVISAVDSLPGFFVSAGYSGHGFGIGPAAGQLAADLIAGDRPIVDPHPYRHSRMIDGTNLGAPGMM